MSLHCPCPSSSWNMCACMDSLPEGHPGWSGKGAKACAARWICAKWDKVSRCWSKTYEECRSQLSWPTVQQRHQLLSCCQTFKTIHNLDCVNIDDYLCFNQFSTRSHSLTLRCTRSRIRYSFFVNIPFLWNTIPYDIVNSTSYAAFKYTEVLPF